MSSNLNYKQSTNVERRTWDLEEYEKKAQARNETAKAGDKRPLSSTAAAGNTNEEKEEFVPAAPNAAGPERSKRAFLKARGSRVVDIDSKVGSTEIVSTEAVATTKLAAADDVITPGSVKDGVTKTGVGWHCKVCDCFLKDSHTYLDHINGRKHQRNLGYSMRVEQSSKEQVQARLAELAKETQNGTGDDGIQSTNFEDVVKAKDEELQKRKEERARKRQERKKRLEQEEKPQGNDDENEEEEVEEEGINPDMAAMMGFAGFGGGSKTR